MPRAKKTPNPQKKKAPIRRYARKAHRDCEWGGFVNVRMDEQRKADFRDWWSENEDLVPVWLSETLMDGMKYSVTYDSDHACFIATFTGTAYGDTDFLQAMSARASSITEATALLLFKHGVLGHGDWLTFDGEKRTLNWG